MKLLLSAIACHPKHGSESSVGWKAATALSKRHHVHVVTWEGERNGIQEALTTGAYPNLSFTYLGTNATCHENRLIARIQSWNHYVAWTRQSLEIARKLVAEKRYDIAHHVTYSSWRVPSPLWQLDLPFVWGPVGGVAKFPRRLLGKISFRSAMFEVARNFSNRQAMRSRAMRECLRNSSAVVVSNKETFDKLLAIRGRKKGLHILFPVFFTEDQLELLRWDAADKPIDQPLQLFAGGNMIGSKGLIFALEALQAASRQGIEWRLVVGGHGPETPFLRKKAQAFGIADRIDFHVGFAGEAYREKLKQSHVFILPSFRENAPGTILEAMLAGCVPVVVDASAQGDIVSSDFGFKVPVGSATGITDGIAAAIVQIARNPSLRISMGQKASDFVARTYLVDNYINGIEAIYQEALETT